jgi:hypothetical protein
LHNWPAFYFQSPAVGNCVNLFAISEADSFKWNKPWDTVKTNYLKVKLYHEGTYKFSVTAYKTGCIAKDSITIYAVKNNAPKNDSICNAIELKVGKNGLFTNLNATFESNEPCPPETNCNTQKSWCQENGLQNTIWFCFFASESGIASFTADGFDNQLAVYKAKSSDSIILGNYKLLAANDDYYGSLPSIVNLRGLVANEKYFLQFDGSGGGVSGNCNIFYFTNELTISADKDTLKLKSDEGSCDSLAITSSSNFSISSNVSWLGYSPSLCDKSGTITISAKSENTTGELRKGIITATIMRMKSKNIIIIQESSNSAIKVNDLSEKITVQNPFSDILTIKNLSEKTYSFTITNMNGQTVYNGDLNKSLNNFDLHYIPTGIYILKIQNENNLFFKKLVKD